MGVFMRTVNIISKDDGGGLSRNIGLLRETLQPAGWDVRLTQITEKQLWEEQVWAGQRAASRLKRARAGVRSWLESRRAARQNFTVNLFMESLVPEWFAAARYNCLIPNPEWFQLWWRQHLPRLDLVLCKTRHAERIFQALGAKAAFVSFTSVDRFQASIGRDGRAFLHVAGRSRQKGTATLVALWQRHPEWPRLTVVQHPEYSQPVHAENIDLRAEVVDDATLQALQNRHGVHLCPSETEGFGHYLVEALSCGALVVTTDAPPMNEQVTRQRGLLAAWATTQLQRLATNYYVDPAALKEQIETAIHMPACQRDLLCGNARSWYEVNDQFFRAQLVARLDELVARSRWAA